jgi:hypothetical protein
VVLCLVPLREGELRVQGARWCLYGEVWGRHTFKRDGRLMQKTRVQRSTRQVGEALQLRRSDCTTTHSGPRGRTAGSPFYF